MRIFSHDQPVVEITATELGKKLGAVLDRVCAGDRVVITRNGREVAVILSLAAGIEVMLAGSERFAALRREAREELEAGIAEVLEAWRVGTASG